MRGGSVGLFVALTTLVVPTALKAQRPGPYIPDLGAPSAEIKGDTRDDAREAMRQFALCIATRLKARAMDFVNLRLDVPDYNKRISKLAESQCLGSGALKFQAISFRGTLFEAFYTVQFRDGPPANMVGFAGQFRSQYSGALPPFVKTILALETFGECVGLKDTVTVHALLKTLPGSAAETSRFQSLAPHFSGCVPKGETFSFSKPVLRGALAEGLYWMAVAARDPDVQPKSGR